MSFLKRKNDTRRVRECRPRSAATGRRWQPSEVVQVAFEIGDEFVSIILENGDRHPLFPSERIAIEGSVFSTRREALRQTIATIMEDMEPETEAE